MEINGTIYKSLDTKQGTSAKGPWLIRNFVIQTMGQYPQLLAIEVANEKGDILKSLKKGDEVKIHFDLNGREYNGKFYVSIKAFKIEAVTDTGVSAPKAKPKAQREVVTTYDESTERNWETKQGDDFEDSDGLPF